MPRVAIQAQMSLGERVKVVLLRHFREMPVDIMRGTVTSTSSTGVKISGRHFQEVYNDVVGRYDEYPLSRMNKIYFIPTGSIKYVEIILPDSPSAELADRVENNPVLDTPVKEYTFAAKLGSSQAADATAAGPA